MCDECYCQIPPFSILKQNMNCEVEEFHGISFIFLLVVPRRIHNMQILNDFCLKSPCVYLCVWGYGSVCRRKWFLWDFNSEQWTCLMCRHCHQQHLASIRASSSSVGRTDGGTDIVTMNTAGSDVYFWLFFCNSVCKRERERVRETSARFYAQQ